MDYFIKKHPICTIFLLILFVCYIYLYFTKFRYDDDKRDFRHYPIPPLTEKWTKTIEYKTLSNVKFRKCFSLSLNNTPMLTTNMLEKDPDKQQYNYLYVKNLTNEQYYAEAQEKPHLKLKIYKDDVLLEQKQVYFTILESGSMNKFDGEEMWSVNIEGYFEPERSACYAFAENTDYKIELINDTVLPKYQNTKALFTIRPPGFAK